MSVVYTGGTFDLFHVGHIRFLKQCHNIAGKDGQVIVALNTDEFIEEYKGKPPIHSLSDRTEILMGCRFVDCVVVNEGGADSKPSIAKVSPDFVVIGSDWASKDYYTQMQFTQEWLDGRNIGLVYVPYTEGISSSAIKTILNENPS